MPPIYLTSGAYQSKSVTANVQRCVNLYPEENPKDTQPSSPTTHYVRPGKVLLSSPDVPGRARGLYTATNGDLYAVVGSNVYFVDGAYAFHLLGAIDPGSSIVYFADNGEHAGNAMVIVDGTANGYVVTLSTHAFAPLVDPTGLFVGSDIVLYVQTFFLFNWPGTQNWYISLSDSTSFNALDVAGKAGYSDNIIMIGVRQREVWLIGSLTSEPWSLTGAADFPFESIPSTFIAHGCIAKYSVIPADGKLFWLTNDLQGKAIFVKSEGYEVKRISHYGIEQMIQKFIDLPDCVGSSYQIEGHTFLVWTFRNDDKTLVYDISNGQWHEEAWTDNNGVLHRDRTLLYANAYGKIVGLDWETGDLVHIDPETYEDNDGTAITCIRSFPHVLSGMNRITHWALVADIQCGTIEDPTRNPILNMRYSDDRGQTFSTTLQTSMGMTGQYDTSPQFNNLGMARDRVYEFFWAEKMETALNAVYLVDPEESES